MSTPGERLAAEQRHRVAQFRESRCWQVFEGDRVVGHCFTDADAKAIAAALNREALTDALVEALLAGCREKCGRDSRGWWHSAMCPLSHDQRALIARYEAAS